MARRHPWRTHVVSLYWRTRHLLLRFLCLHEAVILPFVVAIFLAQIPYFHAIYPFALRRLPTVELCSPCGEVPWSIAAVNRRARDSSLAMTHTVSALSVWGFRMHAKRFMGSQNANFAKKSDSEDFGPALADALPPSSQEVRPSAAHGRSWLFSPFSGGIISYSEQTIWRLCPT